MSYKSSSDQLNYIARTGSHATKPFATGRVDILPENAKAAEEYFTTIHERYERMKQTYVDNQQALAEINKKLRTTMRFLEFEATKRERDRLAEVQTELQPKLNAMRIQVRKLAEEAWAVTWMHIAETVLPPEWRTAIDKEVQLLLGRGRVPVKAGKSEQSDVARETAREKEKRADRRKQSVRAREFAERHNDAAWRQPAAYRD